VLISASVRRGEPAHFKVKSQWGSWGKKWVNIRLIEIHPMINWGVINSIRPDWVTDVSFSVSGTRKIDSHNSELSHILGKSGKLLLQSASPEAAQSTAAATSAEAARAVKSNSKTCSTRLWLLLLGQKLFLL